MMRSLAQRFDGAYSLVLLNALGDMLVARDPLGLKPLCYAFEGSLFAAASESVALLNLGFRAREHQIAAAGPVRHDHRRPAGSAAFRPQSAAAPIASSSGSISPTWPARWTAAASICRARPWARNWPGVETVPIDEDTIVVPVPDTSKAAADAMAFKLKIPSLEGLIRNRYTGRTFIEGSVNRKRKAETKYTPLREVLEGKKVFLVEDSIVRSTTMKVLLNRIRELGRAREIHVRVACPPIIAPCFYGIDMSTVSELFAPHFLHGRPLTEEIQAEMAATLGADSLRYLPVESIARAIGFDADQLCQACITGEYPSKIGQQLYQIALGQRRHAESLGGPHLRNPGRRHHRLTRTAVARLFPPSGSPRRLRSSDAFLRTAWLLQKRNSSSGACSRWSSIARAIRSLRRMLALRGIIATFHFRHLSRHLFDKPTPRDQIW